MPKQDSPDKSDVKTGIDAVALVGKETLGAISRIIALIKLGMEDKDWRIRLFTLLSAVTGFYLLVVVLLFSLNVIVVIVSLLAEPMALDVTPYMYAAGGGIMTYFLGGIPTLWRVTRIIEIRDLDRRFNEIDVKFASRSRSHV